MKKTGFVFILLVLPLIIGSCQRGSEAELEIKIPVASTSILPVSVFSCADVRNGSPSPNTPAPNFSVNSVEVTWKGRETSFVLSYISIVKQDINLECYIEGSELIFLATGTDEQGQIKIPPNGTVKFPADSVPCKITCSGFNLSNYQGRSFTVEIQAVGVDDSDRPRSYRALSQIVVNPAP